MTGEELYRFGRESRAVRTCIPGELIQSLPRLERINGRTVLQFWYYHYDAMLPFNPEIPWFYAAVDPQTDTLVEMEALTTAHAFYRSWLDLVVSDPRMREVRYLDHCAGLLERGNITEEEIDHSQALWLDAQASETFSWLYMSSGIRPEAVRLLLTREQAQDSRYLLRIWEMESMKYRYERPEGWEKVEAVWQSDSFWKDRWLFARLRDLGPRRGSRAWEIRKGQG